MRTVTVAATQMACSEDREANIDRAEGLIREAAGRGAQIVLIQELFEGPYFCKEQLPAHFLLAQPFADNPMIARMSALAAELGVVLPLSFFERAGNAFFNSLAMVDADGSVLGFYRKSHIPDGPGYQEKFYFSPGDTGFKVWQTHHGALGVGICWDQWFPEAARSMALMGAEILLYPTAIGSEPEEPELDSRDHWQRVMQGHAGANILPLVASNRIGVEHGRSCELTFYGSSFITDHLGAKVAEAGRSDQTILTASFDLDAIGEARRAWGVFRDRRPELYGALSGYDGSGETR
ncbi:N-carbamoylputrescine amidase [Acidihalobacter yilgarnensis]|uniref:N-carbamoylputrescine amidase n=1 Tax=Acidihalobacter yilgarnensis TaxID=2819280 RepID=A0A1D8ILU0_9GAMM|nr:N-carbamoylputrescine amidase [Acidihalobacter yilgarnensis]AOU97411.1 N-carbamoylputrescine amidase [Acidihalobacter yilgarnensis]